jgi:hypothetical protein
MSDDLCQNEQGFVMPKSTIQISHRLHELTGYESGDFNVITISLM